MEDEDGNLSESLTLGGESCKNLVGIILSDRTRMSHSEWPFGIIGTAQELW